MIDTLYSKIVRHLSGLKWPVSYNDVLERAEFVEERYRDYIAQGKKPYYIPSWLGWEIAPNAEHSLGMTSNNLGFRNTGGTKGPGISFWGCSLVEGREVPDEDTWLWQLHDKMSDHNIYNGGVCGYGIDQAYLRFANTHIPTKVAFLCYATTDLLRCFTVQRMFMMRTTEMLFLKPRYIETSDGIRLITPPYNNTFTGLSKMLSKPEIIDFTKQHDPFYPSLRNSVRSVANTLLDAVNYQTDLKRIKYKKQGLSITFWIFMKFFETCRERGIKGQILFLPNPKGRNRTGDEFDTLIKWLNIAGLPYLDLRCIDWERDGMLMPKQHYSKLAGELISDYLAERIE